MRYENLFITIEGIDGCGKSTQSERICEWLTSLNDCETLRTFEPGGWSGGKILREVILRDENFSGMSELFLFLADRAGHVEKKILPALRSGKNVVCERYVDSTIAYQASGHGIENVREILSACKFPEPDLTVLLDIAPELAIKRVKNRGENSGDKFESEGVKFMRKVRGEYVNLANENPGRFLKIPVLENDSESEIFGKIISGIKGRNLSCQFR